MLSLALFFPMPKAQSPQKKLHTEENKKHRGKDFFLSPFGGYFDTFHNLHLGVKIQTTTQESKLILSLIETQDLS